MKEFIIIFVLNGENHVVELISENPVKLENYLIDSGLEVKRIIPLKVYLKDYKNYELLFNKLYGLEMDKILNHNIARKLFNRIR